MKLEDADINTQDAIKAPKIVIWRQLYFSGHMLTTGPEIETNISIPP